MTMTAQLHRNATGRPMPVFGTTSRMLQVFDCSAMDIALDIGGSTDLINIIARLPHTEVLLRARQGWMMHYSDSDLKQMDAVITRIFRDHVSEVTVKDDKKGQIKKTIDPPGCYANNKPWTTTWVRAKVTTLLVSKMKINN